MRRHWSVLTALAALAVVTVLLSGFAVWRASTGPAEAASAVPAGTPAVTATEQTPPPDQTRNPTPAPTPAPEPVASPKVRAAPLTGGTMVVIGDGYVADAAWPDLLASELGMRVNNMALSGMGYRTAPRWCDVAPCTSIRGSVAKIAASRPSLVVIAAGEADGDQDLAASAAVTLEQLQAALPDATVVVMSPSSERASKPEWLVRHAEQLEGVASDAGVTWLDVTTLTSASEAFESGSLTPETNGQIAAALERALR